MKLDDKDRCCGRKPIVYKRPTHHLFCPRCDRDYDGKTGEQIENWAWRRANAEAMALYTAETSNHPTIHCNRFPSWGELSEAERNEYRHKAGDFIRARGAA